MATLSTPRPKAARALLASVLASYAQTLFSRRRSVGLLVLLALSATPSCLAFSACSLLGASASLRMLKLTRDYTPYSYNALLCGSALGSLYALTPYSVCFALALGALSVVVCASLAAVSTGVGSLPVAAAPYTLSIWAVLGLAPHLSMPIAAYSVDPLAPHLPHLATLWLQSLGTLVLVPKVLAGGALALALLVHSRIACFIVFAALSCALFLMQLAPHQPVDALIHLVCANGVLAALSLAGVWLVPSAATTLFALGAALLAALFTLGSSTALYTLGLWPGFLPAALALNIALSALRQRSGLHAPQLAQSVAENPEQLVLDHLARPSSAAISLGLPFHGAWICTQGAHGPFTHRGTLAHAYDFEIADAGSGALCRDRGEQLHDYYCFGQPVIAVADGTVVAIENDLPNNAVGDVDSQRPWGNYVIVQHQPEVFSLLAHLSPGSVTVYVGQYVQRGTVLAQCGSSGRSPRPHLHFQLQSGPTPGAATVPCSLQDVLVRTGDRLVYAPLHEPAQGEILRALVPSYALASMFELPLGSVMSYRQGEAIERIVCDLDSWGRCQLRSLDLDAQLILNRSYSSLRCGELRGNRHSVLRLLRLALGLVPFERDADLSFRSSLPRRWITGVGRGLILDLGIVLGAASKLTLESRIEVDAEGLVIVSHSAERAAGGEPLLSTRASFVHGAAAPGPRSIEVSTRLGGTCHWRAELVVEAAKPRRRVPQELRPAAQGLALGELS